MPENAVADQALRLLEFAPNAQVAKGLILLAKGANYGDLKNLHSLCNYQRDILDAETLDTLLKQGVFRWQLFVMVHLTSNWDLQVRILTALQKGSTGLAGALWECEHVTVEALAASARHNSTPERVAKERIHREAEISEHLSDIATHKDVDAEITNAVASHPNLFAIDAVGILYTAFDPGMDDRLPVWAETLLKRRDLAKVLARSEEDSSDETLEESLLEVANLLRLHKNEKRALHVVKLLTAREREEAWFQGTFPSNLVEALKEERTILERFYRAEKFDTRGLQALWESFTSSTKPSTWAHVAARVAQELVKQPDCPQEILDQQPASNLACLGQLLGDDPEAWLIAANLLPRQGSSPASDLAMLARDMTSSR